MAEEDEHSERQAQYDLGRILALSDGIFAIAMTLLILDVPVPQLVAPHDADLLRALRGEESNLLAFALSFWLVATMWVNHRQLLRDVVRTSSRLLWLNVLLLLLICLVPFSAGVLSRYGFLTTGVSVYAANMVALTAVTAGMRVVSWTGGLLAPAPTPQQRRRALVQPLVGLVVFGASIPLSVAHPSWAELIWLALTWPLLLRLGGRASRVLHRRSREPAPGAGRP